jgi:hypothetical protein
VSDEDALYARLGRQIALSEVTIDGQRRLAEVPVDLRTWPEEAAKLHARAGGVCGANGIFLEPAPWHFPDPAGQLGAGAWAAVEAARRVLAQPPAAMPRALCERLGGRLR